MKTKPRFVSDILSKNNAKSRKLKLKIGSNDAPVIWEKPRNQAKSNKTEKFWYLFSRNF